MYIILKKKTDKIIFEKLNETIVALRINRNGASQDKKNTKGLSFSTDQTIYILFILYRTITWSSICTILIPNRKRSRRRERRRKQLYRVILFFIYPSYITHTYHIIDFEVCEGKAVFPFPY